MACLREFELQGYLEESGQTALRGAVEAHLVSCGTCRAAFDQVVATHQRVNVWLSELAPLTEEEIDTRGAFHRVMNRIQAASPDYHLSRLLAPASVEVPWYVSIYRNIHDVIRPE